MVAPVVKEKITFIVVQIGVDALPTALIQSNDSFPIKTRSIIICNSEIRLESIIGTAMASILFI